MPMIVFRDDAGRSAARPSWFPLTLGLALAALLVIAPGHAAAGPVAGPTADPPRTWWPFQDVALGVTVMDLSPAMRTHLGAPVDRGVLVAWVAPGTAAADAGLTAGDVLVALDGQAVTHRRALDAALAATAARDAIAVDYVRARTPRSARIALAARPDAEPGDGTFLHRWLERLRAAAAGDVVARRPEPAR